MPGNVVFAIRSEERDDVRALAVVRGHGARYGFRIDRARSIECRRNGGLWQYTVPVVEDISS